MSVAADQPAPRDQPRTRGLSIPSSLVRFLKGLIGVGVTVGVWTLLRATGVLTPKYVPSFPAIVAAAAQGIADRSLLTPLGETVEAAVIGLAIASALGVLLGALIGTWRWPAAFARVLIRFLRPVPSVALIPAAILAAGLGLKMTLLLVVFASIWPILFNTAYGIRDVPQLYRETGRSLGFKSRRILLRITSVAAFPSIATGIRVSAAIALVVTVSAELITGVGGLGGYILSARLAANWPRAYAGILIGGLLGYLINSVAVTVERRLLTWSAENR